MPYTPPGITVNQVIPQQTTPPSGPTVRTVAVVARFAQGPALARITPDQIQNTYGDPTSPLASSYPGARMMDMVARQGAAGRAYSLNLIGVRAGFGFTGTAPSLVPVGYASVANLGASTFGLYGIGVYTGSAGNRLSAIVAAPKTQIIEVAAGGFGTNEVQQIVFYGMGGSPTGTGATLSFKGTAASAGLTVAQMQTAAALQTYLNGITTIGASGVTVTAVGSALTGALAYQVAFTGTSLAGQGQPLLVVSTPSSVTGGTGSVAVASISIQDTVSGRIVQTISAGQYDLSTPQKVYAALNNANPPNLPASIVQPFNLAASPNMPSAGTYALAGGNDGGAVSAGADPSATIAYQLGQLATGVLGAVDFITSEYDASAVLPSIQTFIGAALPNNLFPKAYLGPQASTTYATLVGTYQTASSDRVLMLGHDSLAGANPVSPGLYGSVDAPYAAAGLAGLKAITSAEFNLYNQALAGLGNVPPTDAGTGVYLSASQLNTLAGAGYTVFWFNPQLGRVVIRDLITTAAQTDQWGQPNRFMWASERDCFDELAKALVVGFQPLLGSPASSPAQVVAQFQSVALAVMVQYEGRYHNGATATVNYNVTSNVVTVNIGYSDRPPLNTIVINLSPMTPAVAGVAA